MKRCLGVGLLIACFWQLPGSSTAQEKSEGKTGPKQLNALSEEDKEVVKTLEAMAEAFNKQDAKTLAAQWSENGVYSNVTTGERLKGRAAIEADFAKYFTNSKDARLSLELESVRSITADVASVDGTARVITGKGALSVGTFQTILIKKNGRWLIDSVRESQLPNAPSSGEHLKQLEWLVGEWSHKNDKTEVKVVGKWVANHNFLARHYTVLVDGKTQHEGTQIVGWDPIQEKIRSWTFDSDGSFGEGSWLKDGKNWVVRAHGVLPTGKKSHVTQILTPIDDNRYGWQTVSRTVDGQLMPNADQVVMQKQKTMPKGQE
jgi:uncharacterized protein (TIGR02246 family)